MFEPALSSGSPLMVLGWKVSHRSYVPESIDRHRVPVVVVGETEASDLPASAVGMEVLPTLYSAAPLSELGDIAVAYGCEGVITFDDELVVLAARLARMCGFAGASPGAMATALGKAATRMALDKAEVRNVKYKVVRDGSLPSSLPLPWIVKPGALSGSESVYLVRAPGEASLAVARATERSRQGAVEQGQALIEEYVDGPNLTVELAVGATTAVCLGTTSSSYDMSTEEGLWRFRERQYVYPSRSGSEDTDEAIALAMRAVSACGLTQAVAHVEMRRGVEGWVVIEINPRVGGANIPEMILRSSGIDYVGVAMAIAMRKPWPTKARGDGLAYALEYIPGPSERSTPSRLSVVIPEDVAAEVYRLALLVRDGDMWDGTLPCAGHVIATGKAPEEASWNARRAAASVSVAAAGDDCPTA